MKKLGIFLAAATICFATPGTGLTKDKVPELTAAELVTAQSRTYPLPENAVFASAIAALQSQGYLDIQASKDAGTISGHTDAKSKLMYNIIWGLGKKKYTQTAQFLVEQIQPGQTSLTLNLFLNESKTRSIAFGRKTTDATLIRQAQPYADLLAAVDQQIARRAPVGTMAQQSAAASAAPTAAVATTAIPTPEGPVTTSK